MTGRRVAMLGLAMVAGLTRPPRAARAGSAGRARRCPSPDQYLSSYPLLAVPAAVGVVAAVYHLTVYRASTPRRSSWASPW